MSKFATVYGLCYGTYPELHSRFAASIARNLPASEADLVIWCNAVGKSSMKELQQLNKEPWRIYTQAENTPKYKAMRELFHGQFTPKTPWIVWFDDDSYIDKSDWWAKTVTYIKKHSDACYIGQPWFVHHLPGQWEFIQQSSWYRGLEPEQCPTRTKGKTKPGITFVQGAYWWLRTDIMKQLDWPDPRLNHNGGDTLLGEAIRQQQLPRHAFHYGVKINKYKRRGFREKPAGSISNVRR
jgi:hypothetical protein